MHAAILTCSFVTVTLLLSSVAPHFGAVVIAQSPAEYQQLKVTTTISKGFDKANAAPPLLIHFHGAPKTTLRNFEQAELEGALLTVNCNGLSSAYRRPFEKNRLLFEYMLSRELRQLIALGELAPDAQWGRIDLSCFSAGYGAVREILKSDHAVRRIESVTAADSIYASIRTEGNKRLVDEEQMKPFVSFARLALRSKKTFLVSHSQLPVEPYASTVETADYLLQKTALTRHPFSKEPDGSFRPISNSSHGRFTVLGFAGSDGESHLAHLRNISSLWSQIRTQAE